MRGTTVVALGIRHVGKADFADFTFVGPVSQAMNHIVKFLATSTMAKRFEFTICRDLESLEYELSRPNIRERNVADFAALADQPELTDEEKSFFAEMAALGSESND